MFVPTPLTAMEQSHVECVAAKETVRKLVALCLSLRLCSFRLIAFFHLPLVCASITTFCTAPSSFASGVFSFAVPSLETHLLDSVSHFSGHLRSESSRYLALILWSLLLHLSDVLLEECWHKYSSPIRL